MEEKVDESTGKYEKQIKDNYVVRGIFQKSLIETFEVLTS